MSDILSDAREWLRENPVGERMGRAHDSECHRRHLECLVSRMAAEIERLREERRWISVEERLPKDGVLVLWCTRWDDWPMTDGMRDGKFVNIGGNMESKIKDFTHWMPLPAPPAAD